MLYCMYNKMRKKKVIELLIEVDFNSDEALYVQLQKDVYKRQG